MTDLPPTSPRYDEFFSTNHLRDDLRRRTAAGGLVTIGGRGLQMVLQLGSIVVLARLLVPEDFGLVAMVAAITGLASMFKDLGLNQAVVQREQVTHEQVSALFWVNLSAGVVLGGLVAASAPAVAWFYDEPRLVVITMTFAAFVAVGGAAVQHQALLIRQMRYRELVAADVLGLVAGIATAIGLALAGAGYWALVALPGVQSLGQTLMLWRWCGWVPGPPRPAAGVRGMLRFGANLTGFDLANYLARNADNVLIGWRWGAGPLGLYTKAYSLLLVPLRQVGTPLSQVAVPALSRLLADPAHYRRAYLRLQRVACTFGVCFVLFAMATADLIVGVTLGPGWEGAATVFAWLAVAGVTQPVSNTAGWLFISQGRTGELLRWGLVSSATTLAAFAVGLPWGIVGVAAAYGLSELALRAPLLVWYVGRRGPVGATDIWRGMVLPVMAGGTVGATALTVRVLLRGVSTSVTLLAAAATATIAFYLVCRATMPGRALLEETRTLVADIRRG